jgi:hypothetical protein
MKNLRIFVFQQHWFHLGSLLEAIIDNDKNYKSVTIYNLNKKLFVKPLERHQDFVGSKLFNSPPESIIARYLKTYFHNKETNFNLTNVKLSKNYKSDYFILLYRSIVFESNVYNIIQSKNKLLFKYNELPYKFINMILANNNK